MSNHINEIIFALSDAGVEFILGGGVAAVLHGVERVTLDVDVALDMQPRNLENFLGVMTQLGLQPRVPVSARDLLSPEAVRRMIEEKQAMVFSFIDPDKPLRHVDVFLTEKLSFGAMKSDAMPVTIGARTFRIVGLEQLLRIKQSIQPPRDKDIFDIKALEKLIEEKP
ncbi:MAG: hypothetical protein ABIR29_03815 [Chthoniobacterales bacterium]